MEKKKIGLIIFVIVIVVAFAIIYHFRDRRTYSLNIPQVENLESISLKGNTQNVSYDDEEIMKNIINNIAGIKRVTKAQSVQDYPQNATDVITVEFHFEKQESSILYLYKKNKNFYIEQPYNGIYKINEAEYKLVHNYID